MLTAFNAMLTHMQEKYSVPGLGLDFAIKRADSTSEQTVHRRVTARDDGAKKLLCS